MADKRQDKEIVNLPPTNNISESDALRVKELANAVANPTATPAQNDNSNLEALSAAANPSPKKSPAKKVSAVNRCFCCSKKTGLSGFKCKCGESFCSEHRLPESHTCTFDHQSIGKQQLTKANPVVKSSKVVSF